LPHQMCDLFNRLAIAKIVATMEKAGITFLPANAQGVGLRGRIKS